MKKTTRITLAILLPLAGFALFVLVIKPITWKTQASRKAIRILRSAQTTNDLAEAVASSGIFLAYPDDSWIAIRCLDSDTEPRQSVAVARDSRDAWFSSTRHPSATFTSYREFEDSVLADMARLNITNESMYVVHLNNHILHNLVVATNLTEARRHLPETGFTELKP